MTGAQQLMDRKYVISLELLSTLPLEAQQDLMDTIEDWFERTGLDDCLEHLTITPVHLGVG